MNFVYITENLITGKKYVGSHYTKKENDGYIGSGYALKHSIKKHGKKNFKRKILKECEILLEARKLEEHYIEKYETLIPNGYNISPTGGNDVGVSGRLSEITKRKIGLFHKKRFEDPEERYKAGNHTRGKTYYEIYDEETANRLIKQRTEIFDIHCPLKGKSGEEHPCFGKKHTDETKQKMSDASKGKSKSKKHKKSLSKAWKKRKIEHPITEETKQKIKKSMLGKNAKNKYKLINKDGEEFIVENLSKFSEDNDLQTSLLCAVANGRRNQHKGWKCIKL